ncbi:EboA domain-containing protein [Pseudomonas sp. 10S4]|uniref:EboA domain-containing protein n=1 Tax=Pseudomonas sp. 10S4 TaxID=3048583 RepID=UPI002AC9EF20|nr:MULTISPECIES: EboA domain-containing protein [unclassified Pseudomonas]MEB0224616.1 EboA domain-containing protein [Pseudomonas sp. 5S1]MEB0295162.1 EboA domain-containing protein [Pseudomonas sp. 10S4]WPX16959.1 EboA domain-containing protein [Pseudomonas sp. 10S4]
MKMDVTAPSSTALEMRHDRLAEQRQALTQQLDEAEQQWWRQAQERLTQHPNANTAALLSSQCKRNLKEHALPNNAGWSHIQLARALLLAQVLEQQPADGQLPLLRQLFLWGDDQEKIATLKALDWLDSRGLCVELALQAGRTSNSQVFAALALDTHYPSRHYPERAFHQLVLKALGMGLDVRRLIGLTQRLSVPLNQLALDLLDEQLAAERTVSAGLPLAIAFNLLSPAQHQRLAGLSQQQRLPPEWRDRLAGTSPN